MKRKLLTTVFCLLLSYFGFSQVVDADVRLKAIYSDEDIQNMKQNSPATLDVLNYNLDHSWFLADESIYEKVSNSPYLYYVDTETGQKSDTKVSSVDFTNFNVSLYYVEGNYDRRVFYRIGDTGHIIGFYSLLELAKMYNQSKNN